MSNVENDFFPISCPIQGIIHPFHKQLSILYLKKQTYENILYTVKKMFKIKKGDFSYIHNSVIDELT